MWSRLGARLARLSGRRRSVVRAAIPNLFQSRRRPACRLRQGFGAPAKQTTVIPREGGVSSTPRLLVSSTGVSGILDAPPQCAIAHKAGHDSGGRGAHRHSRGTNARGLNVVPLQEEGAGNAGCALHPRSRVQNAQRKAHTSIQVQRRQSGIPCAMVLRLMPCSPRRRILFVTVVGGLRLIKLG